MIFTCWFLILNLDYLRTSKSAGQNIGSIKTRGNDIRKKTSYEYFWEHVDRSDELNLGETLFAGEKSSATIELNEGSTLFLNENSLVKFEKIKNRLSIDINFGQVQVDSKSKTIVIKDCGKEIQIEAEGAVFNLVRERACGGIHLKVKTGQVKIAGKIFDSGSDSALMQNDISGPVNKLINTLNGPRNVIAKIQMISDGTLEFAASWDAVAGASEYELEVSPDSEMHSDKNIYLIKEPRFVLAKVQSPDLFFRLRANKSDLDKGEFGLIQMASLKDNLIPPKFDTVQFNVQKQNKLALNLSWKPIERAIQYRLEISDSADFAEVVSQTQQGNKAVFSGLEKTSIYVRIRAESKYVKGEFSSPIFVLFKHNNKATAKVLSEKCIVKNYDEAGPKKDFKVSWQPVPLAQQYRVLVVDQKKLNRIGQSQSRSPASTVTVPACGEYEVYVEAFDKIGRKISSEFSVSKILYKITVALVKPLIAEKQRSIDIFFQKGKGRFVRLEWLSKLSPGNFFRVEVAGDPDFKTNYKQYDVKNTKMLLGSNLDAGTFFWRVREYKDDLFSDWSDIARFRIIANDSKSN